MAAAFSALLPFLEVAEQKSFRKAAERLGVSTAAVSKAVSRLEAELGVPLLTRSSRHVALTADGALYFERCRAAVTELRAAAELVGKSRNVAEGLLRVTLSPVLGRVVVPRLGELLSRHPRLAIELSVTDRMLSLTREEVDVAVRIGALEDSTLVARSLGRPRWATVASPAYLARHGVPRTPRDLVRHHVVKFTLPRGVPREWSFKRSRNGPSQTVRLPSALCLDNGELLLAAASAGLGLVQVFDFMVADDLREGRLVEVLSDLATEGPPIRALCAPGRQKTEKVRVFLELAAEAFARSS